MVFPVKDEPGPLDRDPPMHDRQAGTLPMVTQLSDKTQLSSYLLYVTT